MYILYIFWATHLNLTSPFYVYFLSDGGDTERGSHQSMRWPFLTDALASVGRAGWRGSWVSRGGAAALGGFMREG